MHTHTDGQVWAVKVDTSGRVLLPAALREELEAPIGTELLWVKDGNGLHLKSFEQSLAEFQRYFKSLAPPDFLLSDEIIKERRREAAQDAHD